MALPVDPVDGLLEALQEGDTSILVNELLHGPIVVNVILDLVGVGLELVLDGLKVKDVLVLSEPLLLNVEEALSDRRGQCVRL